MWQPSPFLTHKSSLDSSFNPKPSSMAVPYGNYRCPYGQTSKTYTIPFNKHQIQTLVTKDPGYVTTWITQTELIYHRHLNHLLVGLDVEWRPCFTRGVESPVDLLQLCIGSRCLVFQIIHSPRIPRSLVNFLNNPNYIFTGVGVGDDFKKLVRDYGLGREAKMLDLRSLAADVYDEDTYENTFGLKSLTRLVLKKDIEKPKHITLSLWDKSKLSYGQVEYACLDAFLSFEIGRILVAMQENGRLP